MPDTRGVVRSFKKIFEKAISFGNIYEGVSCCGEKIPTINLDKNYLHRNGKKCWCERKTHTSSHLNGTQQLITSDSNIHNTKSAIRTFDTEILCIRIEISIINSLAQKKA